MRRKIFNIFKALRHFGVSADEVERVAKAYKFWIENPVDFLPVYSNVYYRRGVLYAMPYPIKELQNSFVGIELNGVIYLAGYQCNVCRDKIDETLMWLKGKVFNKIPDVHYGVAMPNQLKLELPTDEEVQTLVEETSDNSALDCVVFSRFSNYWIKLKPGDTDNAATIKSWYDTDNVPCELESVEAHIQPVIHPRESIDFIGHVNRYGVPDGETERVYRELVAGIKH